MKKTQELKKQLLPLKKKYLELKDLVATVEKQYADYQVKPVGYFDSLKSFMLDTLVGGKNINNPELVKILVEQSGPTIEWLKTIGSDLTSVGSFGGASIKRFISPLEKAPYFAVKVAPGVHGANRLGGNAVTDVIVFGRIAYQQAALYVK